MKKEEMEEKEKVNFEVKGNNDKIDEILEKLKRGDKHND